MELITESNKSMPSYSDSDASILFHQFQNTLQMVSSLIMLHQHHGPQCHLSTITPSIQSRILVLSHVYQSFAKSPSVSSCLFSDILGSVLDMVKSASSFPLSEGAIQLHLDALSLSLSKACPMGLILYEILQNVIQHAWPHRGIAQLKIHLSAISTTQSRLVIEDFGPGMPHDWSLDDHLGLQLVDLMAQQLDAQWSFKPASGCLFELIY